MADTSLHYITYDPDILWQSMIETYVENGGDVLYGGDEKENLLRAVQEMIVLGFAQVDNALRMQTVRYAQGDYLKLLGDERGCPYMDATPATGRMRIHFRDGLSPETLTAGKSFTPDGIRFYAIDENVEYQSVEGTADVNITCTEGGISGNGVAAGTAMSPVEATACIERAEIITATSGGADAEEIEEYRERVRQALYLTLTTGPMEQYRAQAMAVSSEIYDASVQNGGAGVVNVFLAIADGVSESDISQQVYEALSADTVRPLTDVVNVAPANELNYVINAEVDFSGDVTLSDLNEAADGYREWQEHTIGRAFDPYQLIAALYSAGATRVTLLDSSRVGNLPLQYVPVDMTTRARGVVNLSQ